MVELWFEDIEWRDVGCELYPRCLECPLERCVEEEPRLRQRLKLEMRAERMRELRAKGRSTAEIAREARSTGRLMIQRRWRRWATAWTS